MATKPKLDIYFLADATGSMSLCIDVVKATMVREYQVFINEMANDYDTQIGVAWYRDISDGPRNLYYNVCGLTNDIEEIQNAINGIEASGGGDLPEAQLLALHEVAKSTFLSGWRPDSTRFIIWFGDEYGHDPVGYPGYQITLEDTLSVLIKMNIRVIAISMAPLNNLNGAGLNQAVTIAKKTGGIYVSDFGQDDNIVRNMHEIIRNQLP